MSSFFSKHIDFQLFIYYLLVVDKKEIEMIITKEMENDTLILKLSGKLYTPTASLLQNEVDQILTSGNVGDVVFDFARIDFLASSGLRVLLAAQKQITLAGGNLTLRNVTPAILNVLEITGFKTFLTIK